MELISKDEAMRRFKPFGREIPKEQVMAVLARIDEGIVRCEKCKYKGKVGDVLVCRIHEISTRADDFCSRGEREEEIQGLEYAESILDSILREQEEGEE